VTPDTRPEPTAGSAQGLSPPIPGLQLMARFTVELTGELWDLGRTSDLGRRRILPITGGRFAGPMLRGEILNSGADWQVVTDAGVTVVDTRYLLRTHDGDLIYLRTQGFRHGPADVMADLASGLAVNPSSYYFRIQMSFETAAQDYQWLNRSVAVGSAVRLPQAVVYDAYLIT
jgi:Protein of unknown function (DUF3237)